MDIKIPIRTAIALAGVTSALVTSGCATQQVSCAHFAHENGVPSTLRHELLAEAHAKGGDCVVSQPR